MSYNVLILTEDFRRDEQIVKPIVERFLADGGKPNAKVRVCRNPNFEGISNLLKEDVIREKVIGFYRMIDLFVIMADRDGLPGREKQIRNLMAKVAPALLARQRLIGEAARQEVEIFLLAGLSSLPGNPKWSSVRADENVKNTTFAEVVQERQTANQPAEGRKALMREAMGNWPAIRQRCKVELDSLTQQLQATL